MYAGGYTSVSVKALRGKHYLSTAVRRKLSIDDIANLGSLPFVVDSIIRKHTTKCSDTYILHNTPFICLQTIAINESHEAPLPRRAQRVRRA